MIEDAFQGHPAVAMAAGDRTSAIVSIAIEQNPRSGQFFRIRVASRAGTLRRALERYAFKFAVSD
jgi:hypothetical protein